jgi:hypothetical protein
MATEPWRQPWLDDQSRLGVRLKSTPLSRRTRTQTHDQILNFRSEIMAAGPPGLGLPADRAGPAVRAGGAVGGPWLRLSLWHSAQASRAEAS